MKEFKSTLKVKTETFSSAELKSKSKEIDDSLMSIENWDETLEQSSHWVKIVFENKKISVPKVHISNAINLNKHAENLDKMKELGIVIACDIVQRHRGNIYTKKLKSSGFSLHICVPKID